MNFKNINRTVIGRASKGKLGKLGVKWVGSRMYTKIHQFPVVAKEFFTKLLEKTGCFMTVNRSEDEKIHPRGLKGYF